MRNLNSRLTLVICVVMALACQLALSPAPAAARWNPNPPPEGTDLTPYLVAGGLVIAGALVYAMVHKSDDAAEESNDESSEENSAVALNHPSLCLLSEQTGNHVSLPSLSVHDCMINPFVDVALDGPEPSRSAAESIDMTIKTGIILVF